VRLTGGKAMAEIAAATAVLDRMVKLAEHADMEARIAALEAVMAKEDGR